MNLSFDLQRFAVFYTSSKAQKLKSDDITLPGSNISGTVPVSVGGTGQTILSAVSVGKANTLTTGRDILTNLESSVASNFNGTTSVAPGTSGILPVSRGGTGVNNLNNITVGKTNSLSTARALQVSLSSTLTANFDGSADVKTIGVQGILQPAQGGTGKTNLGNVTVGTANSLTSAKNITASLSTTLPASFDGSGNVTVGTQGVLPISKGGTGATTAEAARASLGLGSMAVLNGPLSEANGGTGTNSLANITVGSATKAASLQTAKALQVSLNSTVSANFQGNADVKTIGVQGTLQPAQGGTGQTVLSAVTVGSANVANSLSTARSLQVSLNKDSATNFQGNANVTNIGVQGILQPAHGGTGQSVLSAVAVGSATSATRAASLTTARALQVSLGNSLPSSFQGNADVKNIGVTGVLGVSNGGTGVTTINDIKAGKDANGSVISSTYLKISDANSTYLTKTDASNTYLGKSAKAASATSADSATTATTAGSLTSARSLQVSLNNTLASNFRGNANVTNIGVQGTLQPAQGGTGQTVLSSVTVGAATKATQDGSGNNIASTYLTTSAAATTYLTKSDANSTYLGKSAKAASATTADSATTATTAASLTTARSLQVSLGKTSATNFQGNANVNDIGVQGTLGVANGGTGTNNLANVTVGAATKASQDGLGQVITSTYATKTELSNSLATKLDKLNREYHQDFALTGDNSGKKIVLGEFKCYDTNITAEIVVTSNVSYYGVAVLATQNVVENNASSGTKHWTVYGDAYNIITPKLYLEQTTNATIRIYFKADPYSKVFIHIQCTPPAGGDKDIFTLVDEIPTTATMQPTNALVNSFLGINANAASATKLAVGRNILVNLGSTTAASFDGSASVAPGISGTLPVAHGGTGTNSLANITVGKANTLTTARNLQVSLSNTNAASFDGTADVKTIGVQGILPVANGGTGANALTSITVGKANTLTTARALQVSLSSTGAPTFNGTADVKTIGVTGILSVANGGTGTNSLANITVGKVNTLTTARALQVSLSSTGAPTFDGTADVKTIGVTGVLPLSNGGTGTGSGLPIANVIASGSTSGSIDAITAFRVGSTASNKTFNIPAANIKVEYSRDSGATWIDYGLTDSQKKDLFSETRITNVYLGKATAKADNNVNNMLRITINPNDRYVSVNMFYLWGSTNGSTWFASLDVQTWANHDTDVWTNLFKDKQMGGWSGNNVVYFNQTNGFNRNDSQTANMYALRFTFHQTAINANYASACLNDIRCYGLNWWSASNDIVKSNRLYHWDANLNATFPASITASGFNGTATKALQDGSGNVITSTYLTTLAASNNYLGKTAKAASATTADSATTASSLTTARSLQVSLGKTTATNFQGNANVTDIGVQGTLAVANGGTGTNSLTNVTVGKANTLTTARALQVSLSSTGAPTFNGTTDVKTIGVTGILSVANGGTGQSVLSAVTTGAATKATNDGSNRSIVDTYETKANAITGLSASGNTITITKGNGTTSTIGVTGSSQDLSGYLTKTEASSTYLGKTAKAASASTADSASNANYANSAGSAGSATSANTAGQVTKTLTGTNVADLLYSQIASNDYARIRVGGTADNAGYMEIATADDGNEPIYVRQYTGVFATLTRTATLLDESGNTSFPGQVTATTFTTTGTKLTNGTASLTSNITVGGNAAISGSSTISGNASITGNATVNSTLKVNDTMILPVNAKICSPRTASVGSSFSGIKINSDHISGYGADVLLQGGQQLIIASGECGQRSYLNAEGVGKLASIPSGDENLYILSDQKVILRTNCQDILSTAEDIAQFVFDNTGVTAERYILKDKEGTGIGNLFDNNHFSGLSFIGRNSSSVQWGYDVLVQGGNKLILAAGECGKWAYNNTAGGDAYIQPSSSNSGENMYIYADSDIFVRTNCDTLTACKTFKFGADGKFTAPTIVGALSGSATSATTATKATQDGSGNVITSTYAKLSGATFTGNITGTTASFSGTVTLTKTQDLSGTANNSPALIVGGEATAAHLELDANEIHAKSSGTAGTTLSLNVDGGNVSIGSKTNPAKLLLATVGAGVGTEVGGTFNGLQFIGEHASNSTCGYGFDVMVQGGNKLILGAGEAARNAYNNTGAGANSIPASDSAENAYLLADSNIIFVSGASTIANGKKNTFDSDGHLSGTAVLNNVGVGALSSSTWSSTMDAALKVVTANTIAYWNGAYNSTSSNLAYCNKGAFGTIVTKNTGDYLGASATAAAATKLATGRTLKVSLNSTAASTAFDGTAAISNIGVAGTLAIANGGTGLTASPSMLTNLGSTTAANVLAASPRPGITGTLSVANGGTGGSVTGFNFCCSANCTTAAGTAAKVIPSPNFRLTDGATICWYLSNANTHSAPTANVNGTGAKEMFDASNHVRKDLVLGWYIMQYIAFKDRYQILNRPQTAVATTS